MQLRISFYPRRLFSMPRLRLIDSRKQSMELTIDGLFCSICALRTERALRQVPSVCDVSVDLSDCSVVIAHGSPKPELQQLEAALEEVVVGAYWRQRLELLGQITWRKFVRYLWSTS